MSHAGLRDMRYDRHASLMLHVTWRYAAGAFAVLQGLIWRRHALAAMLRVFTARAMMPATKARCAMAFSRRDSARSAAPAAARKDMLPMPPPAMRARYARYCERWRDAARYAMFFCHYLCYAP